MVTVSGVDVGSAAARAGVCAGDVLLSVNGNKIGDVLDYRFYLAEKKVTLALTREGETFEVTIKKDVYDDIGLEFETPLMDRKQCCTNRCIFCFIDQLPKGLRPSLYFKDDDARLSFLHGNYITLTNLRQEDIDRIIKMHISPVNISVHTTNPTLRCEMMKNKRAGEVLDYMRQLAAAGIRLCCQIVLCRGVNDGEELIRTMHDLFELHPAVSSVSVVPAGLTKFREGLYPLEPFTADECRRIIATVNAFGDACEAHCGNRIFCCADELYLKAEMPLPDAVHYGEWEQIENGVGMLRSLIDEFNGELDYLSDYLPHAVLPRRVTLVTGRAAAGTMRALADALMARVEGLFVEVVEIENHFFGSEITVAGLLTGRDVVEELKGRALGDELLLPRTMLRAEGDLCLCGMTPADISSELHVPVRFARGEGCALLEALLGVRRDI